MAKRCSHQSRRKNDSQMRLSKQSENNNYGSLLRDVKILALSYLLGAPLLHAFVAGVFLPRRTCDIFYRNNAFSGSIATIVRQDHERGLSICYSTSKRNFEVLTQTAVIQSGSDCPGLRLLGRDQLLIILEFARGGSRRFLVVISGLDAHFLFSSFLSYCQHIQDRLAR